MKCLYLHIILAVLLLFGAGCSEEKPEPSQPPQEEQPAEPNEPEIPDEPDNPEPEPEPTAYDYPFICGKLSISTENGIKIESKENYVKCTVSLSHENQEWNLTDIPGGIRGRGNSTWEWYPKKPYRIKFDKKQSVLGLGAAKSWVLLAEYRDPTDLMNAFVFELGNLMGLPYTNHNRYVEVTLNGEEIGLYHLTEQVQQGKARVNIDEGKGFLIQLDRDDGPELAPTATDNFWSEVYGMPVCVKNPDEPTRETLASVRESLGILEKAIKGSDWEGVSSLLDINTMIDFIMVQELIYNVELDAPRSMYMHKDIEGKWTMGPLWDFDAGFDFDWGTMYTGHRYFDNYRELVLGTDPVSHKGTIYNVPGFFSDLFRMPEFKEAYKTRWSEVYEMVMPAWETAYTYFEANTDQFSREAKRWPIGIYYGSEIGRMKNWLINRRNYLNTIIPKY